MNYPCVLCSKDIVKHTERYLVAGKGKFHVEESLKSLPFAVRSSSKHICKQCLAKLKKRKSLRDQLLEIEKEIENVYQAKDLVSKRRSEDIEIDYGTDFITPKKQHCSFPTTSTPVKGIVDGSSWTHPSILMSPIVSKRKEIDVTIKVNWPSKEAERKLPDELESLGKMLLRGTYKQIASAAWKNSNLKSELKELMLKEIEKEATALCSKKTPSILRKTDKHSMLSLSMQKVSNELRDRAPLFHSILATASINRRSKSTKEKPDFAPIAMAASICLKNRSQYMTAVQLLLTIFLYHSNWMVSI